MLTAVGELEVRATLTDETEAFLSSEFEAIASGERELGHFDPSCLGWHDIDDYVLTIPGKSLSFSYPYNCAPSGLATLDEVLRNVIISMIDCSPSAHIVSCEIVHPEQP